MGQQTCSIWSYDLLWRGAFRSNADEAVTNQKKGGKKKKKKKLICYAYISFFLIQTVYSSVSLTRTHTQQQQQQQPREVDAVVVRCLLVGLSCVYISS